MEYFPAEKKPSMAKSHQMASELPIHTYWSKGIWLSVKQREERNLIGRKVAEKMTKRTIHPVTSLPKEYKEATSVDALVRNMWISSHSISKCIHPDSFDFSISIASPSLPPPSP